MVGRESQEKEPIALGRRICGVEALLRIHLEIRPENQHFVGICINMLNFSKKGETVHGIHPALQSRDPLLFTQETLFIT